MKRIIFLTYILCLSACLNEKKVSTKVDTRPTKGKFGKICYPISQTPPIFQVMEQRDIDALKDCHELKGTPLIYNIQDSDLTQLSKLKKVDGIDIKSNPNLTSLKGLENLEYVTANIVIRANPKLKDISALSNLKKVDGNIYIDSGINLPRSQQQNIDQEHAAQVFLKTNVQKLFYVYVQNKNEIVLECQPHLKHGWSCTKSVKPLSQFSK